MMRLMRCVLASSAIFLAAGAAWAGEGQRDHGRDGGGREAGGHGDRSVPFFDPAIAGVVAAAIAGGAVVVGRRRRGK